MHSEARRECHAAAQKDVFSDDESRNLNRTAIAHALFTERADDLSG
jgi:hypothetical protein